MNQNFKSPDELHEDSINDLGDDLLTERSLFVCHIDAVISNLDELDVTGHIYWNIFREFSINHFTNAGTEVNRNFF